jgi:hypothetical protein
MIITHKEILLKLEQIENKFLIRDKKLNKHESYIRIIFEALKQLLEKPAGERKKIGYMEH